MKSLQHAHGRSIFAAVGLALSGTILAAGVSQASSATPTAVETSRAVLVEASGRPGDSAPKRKDRVTSKSLAYSCTDALVRTLAEAGFTGENLREAWSIAMRESGGDPTLGPGHPAYNQEDVGLFQFNRPTFMEEAWWDEEKLLDARYSADLAFRLSEGGRNWWLWGLDGQGRLDPGAYTSVWTPEQIRKWIIEPYRFWYSKFPCP